MANPYGLVGGTSTCDSCSANGGRTTQDFRNNYVCASGDQSNIVDCGDRSSSFMSWANPGARCSGGCYGVFAVTHADQLASVTITQKYEAMGDSTSGQIGGTSELPYYPPTGPAENWGEGFGEGIVTLIDCRAACWSGFNAGGNSEIAFQLNPNIRESDFPLYCLNILIISSCYTETDVFAGQPYLTAEMSNGFGDQVIYNGASLGLGSNYIHCDGSKQVLSLRFDEAGAAKFSLPTYLHVSMDAKWAIEDSYYFVAQATAVVKMPWYRGT